MESRRSLFSAYMCGSLLGIAVCSVPPNNLPLFNALLGRKPSIVRTVGVQLLTTTSIITVSFIMDYIKQETEKEIQNICET